MNRIKYSPGLALLVVRLDGLGVGSSLTRPRPVAGPNAALARTGRV